MDFIYRGAFTIHNGCCTMPKVSISALALAITRGMPESEPPVDRLDIVLTLVDAVFKKDFTRVVAIQAELQLIQEQQDIEKEPVFAMKKTLVVDLVLLLQEAMEKRDFAGMNQIQVALRFILEQHDIWKDQRGSAKQACEAELKQLLDQLPSWAVAALYGPWAIM